MNLVEIRKAVGRIKTAVFKNSNSYSIGMLKSHFKGSGLQFLEHLHYTHGDDTRFIDWKLSAKMNQAYIKTFEEERNVEIVVVVDATGTMYSGYNNTSKLQAALEICCLLYLLADEVGDYVEVVILADQIINIPKKRGDAGIVQLIAQLQRLNILNDDGAVNLYYQPKRERTIKERTVNIMRYMKKRRELVFLSDFHNFLDLEAVKKLSYRRNVHCFQIISPLDEASSLPYMIHASSDDGDGGLVKVDLSRKNKEIAASLGKKFKQLKVHERYIESFIKEML